MSNSMRKSNAAALPIAVRIYPAFADVKRTQKLRRKPERPAAMFVFDTETTTDATQRLLFGSYRFVVNGECREEGIFVADDLSSADRLIVENYVKEHRADRAGGTGRILQILSQTKFLDKLYRAAYKGRCLVVGFNLPFDLSRVAFAAATARGRFAGGFSLSLWSYLDKNAHKRPNPHRPRVGIKHIDSKRALKGFTTCLNPDRVDLIPEGSETAEPETGYCFPGHFLDLRTLAFALTDRGHSLESACKAFGVEHGKQTVSRHGAVTDEYIDYNRRDVLATYELAEKLIEEYDKHPIDLPETLVYSPATIGKGYLRAMGIAPILERQQNFPKQYLGYAQSAFFGGRTSAHIRKTPVPVVYTDFLSMYPTVNSLMGLWRYVTAENIRVIENCQDEIAAFLQRLKLDDLFRPEMWPELTAFVRLIPDGDILPARSQYNSESNDWQVGVNHLHAGNQTGNDSALWFALPDVVASVILTGRVPKIIDAFRIEPRGKLSSLKPTTLRGAIPIDPRRQDFFKTVIEQRKRTAANLDLSELEKKRLDKALKVLANSTSYGIYAEMNRGESNETVQVTCHGIDQEPFNCRVSHPENAGTYYFPPLAALITASARLMLALLEHCVTELGGTYAMEDTDSMAIVATKSGGLVPCSGGSRRLKNGRESILALSWKDVESISHRFSALNPYDRGAIPGSILKIEDDNFDPSTGTQRQLQCLAISAKRYALFVLDEKREPTLLRNGNNNNDDQWSEHGLGHLLNPTDPESNDRNWIAQVWLTIIRESMGLPVNQLPFAAVPAVGRITVSSPALMRSMSDLNKGKSYADQIKPFNFILTCHVEWFGQPTGIGSNRFHLIAPYQSDSKRWLKGQWTDQYTGETFKIITCGNHGRRQTARVKAFGDVIRDYRYHPESKCADATGNVCGKQTIGLLQRRHVQIDQIKFIGKESNQLERVTEGSIQSAEDVYTEYPDQRRDEWQTKILPKLKAIPLSVLVQATAMSRRALMDLRAGRSRPHAENRKRLNAAVSRFTGLV